MTDFRSLQGLSLEEALLALPGNIWLVPEDTTPRKGADPRGVFRVLRCREDENSLVLTVCRFPGLGQTRPPKGGKNAADS